MRVIVGLLFAGGAYLLFDASPGVTDIPFAKLTLKDVGIGFAIFLGIWFLLGIAWMFTFGWDGESSSESYLRAEAEGKIRTQRGEVNLDDDD